MALEPEVKTGWKTTEFWLTAVAMVIGLLWSSGVVSPEGTEPLAKVLAFGATALTAMGYSVSRALVKKG